MPSLSIDIPSENSESVSHFFFFPIGPVPTNSKCRPFQLGPGPVDSSKSDPSNLGHHLKLTLINWLIKTDQV